MDGHELHHLRQHEDESFRHDLNRDHLDVARSEQGQVHVAVNLAYNPYCTYDDASCPLPPPENWLCVPSRAGEATYVP